MLYSVLRPTPMGLSALSSRSLSSLSKSPELQTSPLLRVSRVFTSCFAVAPLQSSSNATRFSSSFSNRPLSSPTIPHQVAPPSRIIRSLAPKGSRGSTYNGTQFFSTTTPTSEGRMFPPDRRWTSPKPSAYRYRRSGMEVAKAEQETTSVEQSDGKQREEPDWIKRYRERAQLSNDEEPQEMTAWRRLFPSFLFTLAILGGSAIFALNYKHPQNKNRLFPDTPLALATIGGIIAANIAVYLLWRVPPMWRILNRNFIIVPATPRPTSMLGSVFSHQTIGHLAANMLVLFMWGGTLCDQIGRGNFLAMYASSGAVASFCSLTYHVLLGRLNVTALGASGAIFGLMGAFAFINPDYQFAILGIWPITALYAVISAASIELTSAALGVMPYIDRVAHLSGLAAGVGFMYLLWEVRRKRKQRMQEEIEKNNQNKSLWSRFRGK